MVDVAGHAVAAILTRAPSAGGKSRLFAALGRPPDRDLLAALLLDTLDNVASSGVTPIVCYTPASADAELRALVPHGVGLIPQRDGDLGTRMRRVFDDLFIAGARMVVMVGSDLPLLDAASVSLAVATLDAHPDRVILGPARDGGYYLIAATHTPTELLEDISWSTSSVLSETRRRAEAHRIELQLLPEGTDVDTLDDLRAVIDADPLRAPRTRTWAVRVIGR